MQKQYKMELHNRTEAFLRQYVPHNKVWKLGYIYFDEYIPKAMFLNANSKYAFISSSEKPILLCDDTVFSNGKKGFLITDENFYYSYGRGGKIPLINIESFKFIKNVVTDFFINEEFIGTISQIVEGETEIVSHLLEEIRLLNIEFLKENTNPLNKTEDIVAKVKELKKLVDAGVITNEDFIAKKTELLNKI